VTPSGGDCGCGGSSAAGCKCPGGGPAAAAGPTLVYALGQIGYDFGSDARRDSLIQTAGRNLLDTEELLAATAENPALAGAITWTLNINGAPVYAIIPGGAFAERAHARLRDALAAQAHDGAERTSVPGVIAGKIGLSSGYTVPVIHPDQRGIFTWSTAALTRAAAGGEKDGDASRRRATAVSSFLERVYYDLRNLGIAPQERAINFAATNVFQAGNIFRNAVDADLELDAIGVERSPISRPSGDCWDVRLTFFHPLKRLEQARLVYRFTVDVSDTVPVAVGNIRSWHVY
jgi:cyanobactin maturation PatA/PatG family protease